MRFDHVAGDVGADARCDAQAAEDNQYDGFDKHHRRHEDGGDDGRIALPNGIKNRTEDGGGKSTIAQENECECANAPRDLKMGAADGEAPGGKDHQSTCLMPARR